MKSSNVIASSLDMLLDTMCNTFGGVCFIALLVSVISVSLPPDSSGDADATSPSDEDTHVAMLIRQRNRLAESIQSLEAQLASMTNVTDSATLAETEAKIAEAKRRADAAARENEKRRCEAEKAKGEVAAKNARAAEAEARLAAARSRAETVANARDRRRGEAERAKGDVDAQTKRAAELNDLIAALEAEINDPKYIRARIVRVPHERQLSNYRTHDILLFRGYFYDLHDENAVSISERRDSITVTVRRGHGQPLSEAFVKGPVWRRLLDQTISRTIIRIFTDRASAEGLSILVQDLASRRRPYNWRYNDGGDSITFVEGNDTFVQ